MLAHELETEAFFNLRLTCKDLNRKLFGQFLGCFFKTRYHMLDCHSLQNLLEVSGHPVFSPALHTLEICTDHLIEDIPIIEPGTWIEPAEHEMFLSGRLELADVNEEAYKTAWQTKSA